MAVSKLQILGILCLATLAASSILKSQRPVSSLSLEELDEKLQVRPLSPQSMETPF
jgi:hypothetical protein